MIVASALSGAMDAGQASDQGCDGGVFWVFPKADQVCLLFASSLSLPLPLFFLRMYGHVQVSDVWPCTGVGCMVVYRCGRVRDITLRRGWMCRVHPYETACPQIGHGLWRF